jgi:hypothetical protein
MTMDDLKRQFAALDAVPMPDIRAEIDRRTSMEPRTVRVTTARQTAIRPALVLTPAMVVLLVGMLITALVGATLFGAWLNNLLTPTVLLMPTPAPTETTPAPSPTPTLSAAVSFDCAAAQASAATRTDLWTSGPAVAAPRAGWIAAWGTEAEPEVVLVNPLTGETCSLVTFSGFSGPPTAATLDRPSSGWDPRLSQLAWSPDGGALAIVVVDHEDASCCRHAVYVWSALGLAGPLIDVRHPSSLHVPSWSPDGSLLAIGEGTGTLTGPSDPASAWIIAGDGSPPREVRADCDACFGGSVYWSPSGDQIAFRTWTNRDNGESLGVAAGSVDGDVLALVSGTHGGDCLVGWASDGSLWVVPFGVMVPINEPAEAGHLVEVPLDPGLDRDDHGFLPAGPGVTPGGGAISPDGTQVLQVVERPRALISDLILADFPTGGSERLVEGLASAWGPVWWSPDGRMVGYLVDAQTPDQGIWIVNADGTGRRKLAGGSLVVGRNLSGLDVTLLKVWQPRP